MALGATIDFEAEMLQRAPRWAQLLGLEWLYRVFQEPKRLWPRFMRDLKFFPLFFKQLIGTYKDPFNEESNKITSLTKQRNKSNYSR